MAQPPTLSLSLRASGRSVGSCVAQGHRSYQEDRYTVLTPELPSRWSLAGLRKLPPKRDLVVAVFDGHGGHECSSFCQNHLPKTLAAVLSRLPAAPPGEQLASVLRALDEDFSGRVRGRGLMGGGELRRCGCTANLVRVSGDEVHVANAGDSRSVLVRSGGGVEQLSSDHSPASRPDETERIERAGGVVVRQEMGLMMSLLLKAKGIEPPLRVYHREPPGEGGLNMTRALGDV
ncbi:hypothetical protein TeGR_g5751, partial [Tetraparma gracilis]